MSMSETMAGRLNAQITHEFFASQTYLAMACGFADQGLVMLAAHFRRQAEEERGHGLKILDHLIERGAAVRLQAVGQPAASYASPTAAIEAALAHEKTVTQQIHELVALADQERDYATRGFLGWFVDEQVEEVASMSGLLQVAKLAGNNLLQLDACAARMAESKG